MGLNVTPAGESPGGVMGLGEADDQQNYTGSVALVWSMLYGSARLSGKDGRRLSMTCKLPREVMACTRG
jgi:hypothetical protein